jgi:CBS domain-containing protein
MNHRTVRDVMITDAVAVTTGTGFKDLVCIMVALGVTGVPVVGLEDELVGMVSETDLLVKEELQQDPGSAPVSHHHRRALRAKAAGETAGEVMTALPVTVQPDATVAHAARLMDRHNVSCLPVVDEAGKLLGTVGPHELLQVFLRPDGDIRSEIIEDVLERYLGTNPALVSVDVADGVVTLTGELAAKSMLPFVMPAIRAVDGVVDVEGQLTYASDDTRRPAALGMYD